MDATDRLIETMRAATVAEHEARIAEVQRWADEATDEWHRKRHQAHADRLRAMRYPWEKGNVAA
ncbi:MAG: hypothetical protein H0X01_04740 [Nitrospira sp.]|nr:hypothetical protein [Nitrospira sp.]